LHQDCFSQLHPSYLIIIVIFPRRLLSFRAVCYYSAPLNNNIWSTMGLKDDKEDSTKSPQRITRSNKRSNVDDEDVASPPSPKRVATRSSTQIQAADSNEETMPVGVDANVEIESSNDANEAINIDDADNQVFGLKKSTTFKFPEIYDTQVSNFPHVFGVKHRDDTGRYPLPPKGTLWKWEPREVLTVQKDAALSASNAIAKVWPDAEILEGMCHTHASLRWFSNNKGKLKDITNEKVMTNMLQHYKNVPHRNVVPFVRQAMLSHWNETLRETSTANDWNASWGTSLITRVELNQRASSPLLGGIPPDNNAIESGNNVDKMSLNRQRASIIQFLPTWVNVLAGYSRTDLLFQDKFSAKQSDVHSMEFYSRCHDIIERHKLELPTCLSLQFPLTSQDVEFDLPIGTKMIASDYLLIQELPKYEDSGLDKNSIRSTESFLKKEKWVESFRQIIKTPDKALKDMKFKAMIDWLRSFHIIRPLDPEASEETKSALGDLHYILTRCGLSMMNFDEVCKLPYGTGFISCSCKVYLHYAWCHHAFVIVKERGIVKDYPIRLNPIRLNPPAAGRPKKAHGGEALRQDY
jgi:hypothetical protein